MNFQSMITIDLQVSCLLDIFCKTKKIQSIADCFSLSSTPNTNMLCNMREAEDPRCKDLHFERKSSVKSICTPANSKRILRNDDPKLRVVKKKENEWMDDQMTNYYKEMVAKLCLITDECIIQCNWVPEKELSFEEICMQIGEHILDTLIKQAVDELEGFN